MRSRPYSGQIVGARESLNGRGKKERDLDFPSFCSWFSEVGGRLVSRIYEVP